MLDVELSLKERSWDRELILRTGDEVHLVDACLTCTKPWV